jgi:hypothetical protein
MSLDTLDNVALFLFQVFGSPFLLAAGFIMCLGATLALLEAIDRIFGKSQKERR